MSILANSNAIESGGYNIDRSLRFRSSASAYLNRTFGSPTNNKIFTYSFWLKRGTMGAIATTFYGATNGTEDKFYFSNDNLVWLNNSANDYYLNTTQVFRDPSAWYHIIYAFDSTQATSTDRVKLYVNGSQVTSFQSASYPPQNYTFGRFNTSGIANSIGRDNNNGQYFDGYLAEINFVDGQQLTPSSFGETSTETGVWVPKKYTGTYGTNGFYLNFSDNTSATTLAYDKSGNGNNWTANNISTTAGATYDSMTDVPTLTSATAANFNTLNPLNKGGLTTSNGNLRFNTSSDAWATVFSTIAPSSGKWYWEMYLTSHTVGYYAPGMGFSTTAANAELSHELGYYSTSWAGDSNGNYVHNNSNVATYTSFSQGDTAMYCLDVDNGKFYWGRNGTWFNSGNPASGTGYIVQDSAFQNVPVYIGGTAYNTNNTGDVNFGQRPFSYTPPTGFKALNTFNLPDPTIKKPNQYMDATTYTGNAPSTNTVNNAAGFQPDLVWVKSRSASSANHLLVDAVRGNTKVLYSNLTNAEDTNAVYPSITSTGFTVGDTTWGNGSGASLVGWQWKESATAGFDIVTYTGTGSARTISHNLGVAPKMMIVKCRTNAYSWIVWHTAFGGSGNTDYMFLEGTGGEGSAGSYDFWNNTAPTSSVFSVGTQVSVNENAATYVAYLFAEIPGFSKFGSYTGNGSSDGPFVYCGFRPKYVMIKRTDSLGGWLLKDTSRSPYNAGLQTLIANGSDAEGNGELWDALSNGFKVRDNSNAMNASGGTFIYAAFAESPFKTSLAR